MLFHLIVVFFLIFHALGWIISLFHVKKIEIIENKCRKFASIITAYKNVEVAIPLIESLKNQKYKNHDIFLVADQCDVSICKKIEEKYDIKVILPEVALNSKISSIQSVFKILDESYDSIVVFDPDNIAHPSYLKYINEYMNAGFEVIQGKRVAKNLNTYVACLDALGEFYYNINTRFIPFKIGSSATIAGSGMAISYALYKDYLALPIFNKNKGKIVNSEDKILQTYIVGLGKTIAYASNAIVFDEKVETTVQLKRQRTRWINTWFKHVSEGFMFFKKLSWNSIWFGLLTLYPPMFLLILSAFLIFVVDMIFYTQYWYIIVLPLAIFVFHFIHSLILAGAPNSVLISICYLPIFIYNQVLSMFQMRKTSNDFLVTEHRSLVSLKDI
jgi:cellulose synthase/poly-beta-1,6-N-acetylglucosamine synthase-like glycosyltransferase